MARKYKTQEKTQKAKDVVNKLTQALTWRQPLKDKWDRFYKMYRSYLEPANYPWQSNLWIPYSFSTIETLAPRMVANKPKVDIMPRTEEDKEFAKLQSDLVNFQWDKMKMQTILPDVVKEMLMYGTAIVKVGWKTDRQYKEVKEDVDETMPELGKVEVEEEVTLYDGPVVELVDLYDLFVDPKATTIDNARWVIHRTMKPLSHLKQLQKQGIYKNVALVENTKLTLNENDKSQRWSTIDLSTPVDELGEGDSDKRMVELLEYWEDDHVCTVANREIIIREDENPYKHGKKPFLRVVDQSVPHEFYGIGELEPIESLQYELNNRRNQRMDNVTLALNRMWKVKNGANVDEDELVSDAGGVIHTDDMNGLDVVQMPDVTASSYQEETIIKGDIQQTTGVSDFTRGVGSDALANDTATGISLIQEAGSARFRLKIQNLEEMIIKPLGEMIISMNEQFMEEPQIVRITNQEGMEFKEIGPDQLKSDFDVVVEAGSTMPTNEAVRKKQAMDLYQIFAADPEVNTRELKVMVLEAFGVKNIDKLLPVQQPMMPPMGMEEMGAPMTGEGLTQEAQLASVQPEQPSI